MKEATNMSTNRVNNDFSAITFGRKSVRVYDETVKISHEEMLTMIQEATTAPSSVNMQPWRFVVVESAEQKAMIAGYETRRKHRKETRKKQTQLINLISTNKPWETQN